MMSWPEAITYCVVIICGAAVSIAYIYFCMRE